jgi:hypothetical protein
MHLKGPPPPPPDHGESQIERRAGRPIWELFDVIGGTSTGALLAIALVGRAACCRARPLVFAAAAAAARPTTSPPPLGCAAQPCPQHRRNPANPPCQTPPPLNRVCCG